MPEPHKTNFINLYNSKKADGYKFIIEKSTTINDKAFKYLEFNIDYPLLKCAIELAKEKSMFTMNQSQACVPRDNVTKGTTYQVVDASVIGDVTEMDRKFKEFIN